MQDQNVIVVKEKTKKILPKLKCAFHQNQNLTNFCSCKKCLLPLCPSCIKIHTIEHVNMKTDPQYQNLLDVILDLNLQIKDFISVYEDDHRMLTQIQQKINQFKDQIFTNIDNLKNSLIQEIETYFTSLVHLVQSQISQMKYIQQLSLSKSQLKKSILTLKKFDKNFNDQNVTGKFIVRNIIKYQSNNLATELDNFDSYCKQFMSKVQGNFCTFSLKDNLKSNISNFLTQMFKINMNQISTITNKNLNDVLKLSKKLQQLSTQSRGSQKGQLKNSLTKVMSKVNGSLFASGKKNVSQSQLNNTISYEKADKHKEDQSSFSQIAKQILNSNNKRSFLNHSSQRKSLNISSSFCENQVNSNLLEKNNEQSNCTLHENVRDRRSSSKGKGLSLIQSNCRMNLQQSKYQKASIRFSLSNLQNINLDLGPKNGFLPRRK